MANVTFKTRLSKGGNVHITNANVDFTGCTPEQVEQLAMRSVVIALQAQYRAGELVPSSDDVKVVDLLKRERGGFKATPQTLAAKVQKMSPEQQAEVYELLRNQMRATKQSKVA